MSKIKQIKTDIIYVERTENLEAVFRIDKQYLEEIRKWPSGININIKFNRGTKVRAITPVNWLPNTVFGELVDVIKVG